MSTPTRNLDSVIPDTLRGSSYLYVKDLFGVVLDFHEVSFSKDDRGYKATFTCSKQGEKQHFYVTTRAIQPLKVAKHLYQNKLFPVTAKFVTEGQAVLLVDPDTAYEPPAPTETLDF